jgi:hypothetical protein
MALFLVTSVECGLLIASHPLVFPTVWESGVLVVQGYTNCGSSLGPSQAMEHKRLEIGKTPAGFIIPEAESRDKHI